MEQYTYTSLRSRHVRDEIKEDHYVSLGYKQVSDDFIGYKEDFRILSLKGADVLKQELTYTAEILGVSYEELMETMPKLKGLLK